jgi:hypothetical protein
MSTERSTQGKGKHRVVHESDDRLFNDWLETVALIGAGLGVGGGLFALYYLWQLNAAI